MLAVREGIFGEKLEIIEQQRICLFCKTIFVWEYLEYILRIFVEIFGSQLVIMKRRRLFDFCQTIFVCTINLIASACQTTMLNFGVVMM